MIRKPFYIGYDNTVLPQPVNDEAFGLNEVKKMAKPMFVRFDTPKDIVDKTFDLIEVARQTGKIRKGTNEVTKIVERREAKIVIMAEDVTPVEILAHMPVLCKEREVVYCYVPTKVELGKISGLEKPTASIAITDLGNGEEIFKELSKELIKLSQ